MIDSDLHRALRLKSVETDQSISDMVNEAIRIILLQDAPEANVQGERTANPTPDHRPTQPHE